MNRDDGGTPDEPLMPGDDQAAGLPDAEERATEEPSAYGNVYRRSDRYSGYDEQVESEPYAPQQEDESLRRQLAQFAFVREEDDREVRLTFRDVPAHEIAKTFRASGALLITMTGERAISRSTVPQRATSGEVTLPVAPDEDEVQSTGNLARRSRKARKLQAEQDATSNRGASTLPRRPHRHTGELTMRYFFSLRETVYTVNIASPTGIIESIANIYPSASLSERELQARLAVLFREIAK